MATHLARLDELYFPKPPAVKPAPTFRPETVAGPLRLHLGCGPERRDGWVNIDASAEVKPDIVTRAHLLPMFADASVDTIEACHLFEHLPLHEARAALKEWARVIRPGGELLLEMPNFDACVRILGQGRDARG